MSANISLNPIATTNAAGLFNVNSAGFTQGDAQDDPAVRFQLTGGILSTSATSPLWGGEPITESLPSTPSGSVLGNTVLQATSLATTTGICVFNQAYGGVTTPQSNVPLYAPGMSVNFYRFGSGARIPLRINPTLVAAIDGGQINPQVSWDFTNNWLTTYDGTNAFPVKIIQISNAGNKTVSYNSTTGFANWIYTEDVAVCVI